MAKALFDKMTGERSESAGVKVTEERQKMKLGEVSGAENVIRCMKEEGINLSQNEIKQVTLEMVDWADKIIIMTSKENLPGFILQSRKVKYWEIKDPKGTDLETHQKTRDRIKELINDLVQHHNP